MKAIRASRLGGPEVLSYEEMSLPDPGPGDVRVRIEAAGVNFIDLYYREGLYTGTPPFTLGIEAAGKVLSVGEGVTEFQVGERVGYTSVLGGYAEEAIVPAHRLISLPEGIDTRTAAALLLQGLTAHYLANSTFPLKPGDTALIHAAAGGLGLLLVQLAKRRGARVIGTVSTEEKLELAKEMGADDIILYTREDFEGSVKRLTENVGVDVVYDSVGKTTFDKSLNCLKPRGYMVLFGQSSGPVPPFDPQILNSKGSLFLTRPSLFHYAADRQELLGRAGDLFDWFSRGELEIRIDKVFELADAAEAHRYMAARKSRGKVLLIPQTS